jgi:hypothetical protein
MEHRTPSSRIREFREQAKQTRQMHRRPSQNILASKSEKLFPKPLVIDHLDRMP